MYTSSMAVWAALVLAVPALLLILKKYRSYCKHRGTDKSCSKLHLPPGPLGWPLIGNIPEMITKRPVFKWIHSVMKEMNTDIACTRLGNTCIIYVTCPTIAREMLKKQDAIFASRPQSPSEEIFSGGYKAFIFTPFGDQFKKMKKVLRNRILNPSSHRWLYEKRMEEADHMTAWVYKLCVSCKPVDVRVVGRHYCGNVIRRLTFNKRYFGNAMPDGSPGPEDVEHIDAIFDALRYTFAFAVVDFFPILKDLGVSGSEKKLRRASGVMDKYHGPLIDQRIREWRGEKTRDKIEDFLDVFISMKDGEGSPLLTAEEIKPQIKELEIATVDNPSSAVEWAIAEMMNQPQLLQKVIEELDRVVGRDRQVQESDIPKLNYVKACIREAFRLHPVFPFNPPHVVLCDTTVAGYRIPKGSQVRLSRYGLGRNPKVWSDPLCFKPGRHLNECSDVNLLEDDLRFISFSTGYRGCPGSTLGTTLTVMLLARLLHAFTWKLPPGSGKVELIESASELLMAKPLVLMGVPRLAAHLYPSLTMT